MALAGLGIIGGAIFVWVVARLAVCEPILDMIPVLRDWLDSPDGLLSTLWRPVNEHHLVWMRLLTTADFAWTGGWPVLSGAVSVSLLACMVWIPARGILQAALPPVVAWSAALVVALLVFAPPAAEATALNINGVYPLAAGLATLGLGAAAARYWRLAFVLATLAALGNGVALVMFPILPWLAWRAGPLGGERGEDKPGGSDRRRMQGLKRPLALGLAGIAFCLFYVRGVLLRSHDVPQAAAALRYGAAMLGLPASHSSTIGWLGTAAGGSLGLLGLTVLTRRPDTELRRLAQGGICFGLGAAALGALGRTEIAGGLPAVRYTVLVLPLQIGLLCWVLPRAVHWAPPLTVAVMLLLLGVALSVQSPLAARAMVGSLAESRHAVARFAMGDRDPALEPYVFPDLADASRVWSALTARGLPVCRRGGL